MIVTGSEHYYYMSPIYALIFFVLVGFIYHLIRNDHYKNTLPASIIIGFIIDMVVNPANGVLKFLEVTLLIISLVIVGGFLAVGMKKLMRNNVVEYSEFSSGKPLKSQKWWDKQSPKGQAVMVVAASLLCIIVIIGMIYFSYP